MKVNGIEGIIIAHGVYSWTDALNWEGAKMRRCPVCERKLKHADVRAYIDHKKAQNEYASRTYICVKCYFDSIPAFKVAAVTDKLIN